MRGQEHIVLKYVGQFIARLHDKAKSEGRWICVNGTTTSRLTVLGSLSSVNLFIAVSHYFCWLIPIPVCSFTAPANLKLLISTDYATGMHRNSL